MPRAFLAYKTYGTLAADKSNAVLYPTSYGAHHTDIDWLIGPGRILDPARYFIVIPNQFGNGLSSSPSNLAEPFGLGRNPPFSHWDNVHAQRRLLEEKFGITKLKLIYGWSMGGQQALHWGAIFPDKVERICALCTSARTSPHNKVFLEGIRATLTADGAWRDGRFIERPVRAHPRVRARVCGLGHEPGVLSRAAVGDGGFCVAGGLIWCARGRAISCAAAARTCCR